MIAVIFEVQPHAAGKQQYLDIAAQLRPLLEQIDGFVSIERFQSLGNPDKILRCPSSATKKRSGNGATWRRTAPPNRPAAMRSSRTTACALQA